MFDLEALLYYEQKLSEEQERAGREMRRSRDLDFDHDFETFQELLAEAREAARDFGADGVE